MCLSKAVKEFLHSKLQKYRSGQLKFAVNLVGNETLLMKSWSGFETFVCEVANWNVWLFLQK